MGPLVVEAVRRTAFDGGSVGEVEEVLTRDGEEFLVDLDEGGGGAGVVLEDLADGAAVSAADDGDAGGFGVCEHRGVDEGLVEFEFGVYRGVWSGGGEVSNWSLIG